MHPILILLLIVAIITSFGKPPNAFGQEDRKIAPSVPIEKGGALLPKGQLVIEPGLQYSHFSRNLLSVSGFTLFGAILIGQVRVEKIERDVIVPYLEVGYGFRDIEFELKVPWFYRRDDEIVPVQDRREEIEIDDSGLGDIEGAVYMNLIRERRIIPAMTGHLRFKSRTGRDPYGLERRSVIPGTQARAVEFPTGSGHWGISGGLTFVKTSDPAILFLNLTYFYNIARDVGLQNGVQFGRVDPGDSIEYSLGTSFALNEKLSLSFSFDHRFTGETEQNGVELVETDANVASFNIGGFYSISDRFSMGLSLGIGLTEDAPDVSLTLRIPIRL